jgi:hypothetical protein
MRELEDFPGYFVTECGKVFDSEGVRRAEYLTGVPAYKYVSLPSNKTKRGWQVQRVHILVAKAYIPNPDNLEMVDHKDRDKLNNHKDNLRWVSRSGNNRNRTKNVFVEWCGEKLLLVELVDRLYGAQKPHYLYIWKKLGSGNSIEDSIRLNNEYRKSISNS